MGSKRKRSRKRQAFSAQTPQTAMNIISKTEREWTETNMLASGSKIRRQMGENVRHKRLNPRKRAPIREWGFPLIRRERLLKKSWKGGKSGNLADLMKGFPYERRELRKKPFKRRKSEDFSEKSHTSWKSSPSYGLPMKGKM